MTNQQIIKQNIMIALFMGYKATEKDEGEPTFTHESFKEGHIIWASQSKYHLSWEWLMPVVEKICRLKIEAEDSITVYAYPRTFGMLNEETGQIMVRFNGFQLYEADTLIDAAYMAVIEFIDWYNRNEYMNKNGLGDEDMINDITSYKEL